MRPFPPLLSISMICLFACGHHDQSAQQNAPDHGDPSPKHVIDARSIIHEGQVVDELRLEVIGRASPIRYFSLPFDSIIHYTHSGPYSVSISYPPSGAYFYYLYGDSTKGIFAMNFDTAFMGKTGSGFSIRDMVVRDMLRIYGV